MMEPAAYGASVMFGPHTSNFRETVEQLLARQAACRVADADELTTEAPRRTSTIPRPPRPAAKRAGRSSWPSTARRAGPWPSSTAWSNPRSPKSRLEPGLRFELGSWHSVRRWERERAVASPLVIQSVRQNGATILRAGPRDERKRDRAPDRPNPQAQTTEVVVDDSSTLPSYSNFCRVTATPEEVILDFGLNPQPFATGRQDVKANQRIVMNFYTAKRLLTALGMTIQRHEGTFGSIELDVRRRATVPRSRRTRSPAGSALRASSSELSQPHVRTPSG